MTTPPNTPAESTRSPNVTVIVVPFRLCEFVLQAGHRSNTPFGTTLITGNPGQHESLDDAARRIMTQWVGDAPQYVEQLYTLSTDRISGREVAVSYLALYRESPVPGDGDSRLFWSASPKLAISDDIHRMVYDYALVRLRAKLGYTNIAFHLLPPTFTLSELQRTYEEVLGHQVDKRNFRRRMTAAGTLVKTSQMRREGSHRPAATYRFATQEDPAAYLTPSWAAASFSHRTDSGDDME